ncbi:MAG: hypothetical protein AAFR52_05535 [Pseudomonadota bacterium]
MSTRASLLWILVGLLLAGYVAGHVQLARTVEIAVTRIESAETRERFGFSGTAHTVVSGSTRYALFVLPWIQSEEEMLAALRPGARARVRVIDWLHGPLVADVAGIESRPNIVEVLD